MSKYLKSTAVKMSNLVKHKKAREPRVYKNKKHAENAATGEAFAEEFFHDDGMRRMKGYQHAQRSKITLSHISILDGMELSWQTKKLQDCTIFAELVGTSGLMNTTTE